MFLIWWTGSITILNSKNYIKLTTWESTGKQNNSVVTDSRFAWRSLRNLASLAASRAWVSLDSTTFVSTMARSWSNWAVSWLKVATLTCLAKWSSCSSTAWSCSFSHRPKCDLAQGRELNWTSQCTWLSISLDIIWGVDLEGQLKFKFYIWHWFQKTHFHFQSLFCDRKLILIGTWKCRLPGDLQEARWWWGLNTNQHLRAAGKRHRPIQSTRIAIQIGGIWLAKALWSECMPHKPDACRWHPCSWVVYDLLPRSSWSLRSLAVWTTEPEWKQ